MPGSAGPSVLHRYDSSSLSYTEACSTSHVWIAPGDIFQHCASARVNIRDFERGEGIASHIHENMQILSHHTNFGGSIAPPEMKLQIRQAQKMKARTLISMLRNSQLNLTEESRARRDQRSLHHG